MNPNQPNETTPMYPVPLHAAPAVPPVQPNPSPVPATPAPKVNPIEKLKTRFNGMSKNTKMLVTIMAIVFAILFILLLLVALFGKKPSAPAASPSPSPVSVSPAPNVILNASRYATDSGVLKMEDDLNGFQKQLDGSDVKQTDLSVPNMDFNINFNK